MSINTINPVLLAPSSYRKNELEKGILASIAMHAVLENVNSDFLKIKVDDNRERSKNSLGPYFIQGLILQGIYKKTIFMLDVKECLKVLSNFRDFNTYLLIYGQKMLKRTQVLVDDDPYLPQRPKHDHEVDYTIFCLQKSLFEYQVANRFETISNRYYKEYSSGSA